MKQERTSRELVVSAETLAAEVGWMARLKAGTGLNPACAAMQVSMLLGGIQLRRTDFEQFRETVIPATGGGQASITVDPISLANQLKKVSGSAVISIEEGLGEQPGWLSIKLSDRTVRLRDTATEFVKWPTFESTDLPATVSARQITRVLTSVGNDLTLPALTVVAFDGGSMITTDRFRLTQVTYSDRGFTTRAPGAVLAAFAGGDEAVTVWVGVNDEQPMLRVTAGARSVLAPVPDVDFPKWRQLIPEQAEINMLLRRDDLLAAAQCDRVTLAMKDTDTMVVTSTDDARTVEVIHEVTVTMLEPPDELPPPISLRTKFLAESLRAIGSGAIRFKMNAVDKPVLLEDIGSTDFHLVMPVRDAG